LDESKAALTVGWTVDQPAVETAFHWVANLVDTTGLRPVDGMECELAVLTAAVWDYHWADTRASDWADWSAASWAPESASY
jgi:hypothetical protein